MPHYIGGLMVHPIQESPKNFKLNKIGLRIAISVSLTTLFVTLILSYFISQEFEKALVIEAERNLNSILEKEAESLNQEFTRVKRLSQTLKTTVVHSLNLSLAKPENNPDYLTYMSSYKDSLIPHFKDHISNFSNISGWVLFNSKVIPGKHTLSYTFENGAFLRESEYDAVGDGYAEATWWKEAIKRGEHWTVPYYWETWDADIISYSIPIIINDELVAVTGAEFFMTPFQDRLRNIKVYNTGFLMLITNQGQQIYLPEEANKAFIQDWYNKNATELLSQKKGIFYENRDKLLSTSILSWQELNNGWLLIAEPKASEMFGALKKMYFIILLIIIAAIPLSILVGFTIGKAMTHRLEKLTHQAENLLKDHEVSLFIDNGNDEISILSRAFNQMYEEVHDALKNLKFSESKYRILVENSDHMIFTISPEGKLLTTNKKLEDTIGLSKSKLQGQHFCILFEQDETRDFWSKIFNNFIENPTRLIRETTINNQIVGERQLITTLLPVFNDEHNLAMIMGTSSDITDRVKAEREVTRLLELENQDLSQRVEEKAKDLEKALYELMQTDKLAALGRLVAGIAHEMNTPVGNAVTLASHLETQFFLMEKKGNYPELKEIQEAVHALIRNLNRTVALIDHFKNMSIQQNSEKKVLIQLDVLIQMTVSTLSMSPDYKVVSTEINCPSPMEIISYPGAINQVLTHIINNAFHHAFKTSQTDHAKIFIDVKDLPDHVSISITDNGDGISEEIQKHIFEPFFTTRRGLGYSGLGLSIVFNIITSALGGRIHFTSIPYPEKGHGTTFTFYLPK